LLLIDSGAAGATREKNHLRKTFTTLNVAMGCHQFFILAA
jgi:hypothetical protein